MIHYKNLNDWLAYAKRSEATAIAKEYSSWEERKIWEMIWYPA
jgi:hypothetical protein